MSKISGLVWDSLSRLLLRIEEITQSWVQDSVLADSFGGPGQVPSGAPLQILREDFASLLAGFAFFSRARIQLGLDGARMMDKGLLGSLKRLDQKVDNYRSQRDFATH
jgi:hypothetical protein